jgi:hypothetical protein
MSIGASKSARVVGRSSVWLGLLISALALPAGIARADLSTTETVVNDTSSPQSSISVVFQGDVRSDIHSTLNPFGSFGTQVNTYDPVANTTTITFSSTNSVAPGDSLTYGISFIGDGFDAVGSSWEDGTTIPILSITANPMSNTGIEYYGLIFDKLEFLNNANQESAYMLAEAPFPGGCGSFTVTNNDTEGPPSIDDNINEAANDTVSTFDSAVGGDWITWPIPLDELNPTDTPIDPPLFWSVGAPPEVGEGQSFTESICVPAPRSAAAAGALMLLLGVAAGWKNLRKARD